MKRLLKVIIVILTLSLITCCDVSDEYTTNIEYPKTDIFRYKGTWRVEDYHYLSEEESSNYELNDINGAIIKLSIGYIEIFDYVSNDVKYKLKVVDKDYVISYEHNIKAEQFMDGKEKIDVISLIDNNNILCEFFMTEDEQLITITKGLLIKLKKISDEVSINSNNIYNDNIKMENNDVGVMVGLKKPRELNYDGTFTDEEYRTIWISYEDNELASVYEKNNIIFPRLDGIWNLRIIENNINEKHYESFEVSNIDGRVLTSSEHKVQTNIYKTIKFVGNDYIAIEKYEGENFENIYPIHHVVPVNNVNIEQGLSIDELFSTDAKTQYINDFNNAYASLSDKEKAQLSNQIDFTSISMERRKGRWVLRGQIEAKDNSTYYKSFDLALKPNSKLINFNSLLIPWKNLKGEISFIQDAFSAPNGSIIIVRFKDYLTVYETDRSGIKESPLISIPLKSGEEVIMAEWCEYGYVDQWEKVFIDGDIIN